MRCRKPRRPRPGAALGAALCLAALSAAPIFAQPASPAATGPARSAWTTKDIAGQTVTVPGHETTLTLFLMADQPQSREALKQTLTLLAKAPDVQLIVIVSGEKAPAFTARLAEERKWSGPIVADTDYSIVGQDSIHVWPTAEVILPSGEKLGHLPGLPSSFAHDLSTYLDCAAGKIDRAQLAKRLADEGVIDDSPLQAAHRHLHLAEQLLGQGRPELARSQLLAGLKLQPSDTMLLLALADVDITLKDPDAAVAIVDHLPAGTVPKWQSSLLRGRALVAKDQWDAAAKVLPGALELNPQPAEAHYLIGLVYQHQGQWEQASGAFREAFEATRDARQLEPTP